MKNFYIALNNGNSLVTIAAIVQLKHFPHENTFFCISISAMGLPLVAPAPFSSVPGLPVCYSDPC